MPTITSVHAAIDQHTLSSFPSIPVIFGNTENLVLSEQQNPFLKQRVLFVTDSQFQLGDVVSSKKTGSVIFIVHTRKNTGDADRNSLQDLVLKSFRSKVIGGATFLNARVISSGETENWSLTGIEIPFFFYETQ